MSRALDALVAEKVLGYHPWTNMDEDYNGPHPMFCAWDDKDDEGVAVYTDEETGDVSHWFAPSSDLAAAWTVVEQLQAQDVKTLIQANLTRPPTFTVTMMSLQNEAAVIITETSAPLAICLAALKAVGVEVPA